MADFQLKFTVDGAQQSELSLAFQGRLMEEIDKSRARISTAYPKAMSAGVVEPGKKALRATIEASGFYRAGALAKTWRGYTYPGNRPALDPTGWFKSRAGLLVDAHEQGVSFHASTAKFLAIPQGPGKAIVHRLNQATNRSREGGKFAKEDGTVQRVAAALGVDLIPIIDQKTDRGVLVAASDSTLTRGGRVAKRQTSRSTPIFALVRQATLKPRPMGKAVLDGIAASAESDFVGALAALLPAEDAA